MKPMAIQLTDSSLLVLNPEAETRFRADEGGCTGWCRAIGGGPKYKEAPDWDVFCFLYDAEAVGPLSMPG